MLGIFEAITDFFTTIFSLIAFLFKGLLMLFKLLTTGLGLLVQLISILPTQFTVAGVLLIVVCVLYKVLGRENQS